MAQVVINGQIIEAPSVDGFLATIQDEKNRQQELLRQINESVAKQNEAFAGFQATMDSTLPTTPTTPSA